MSNYIEYQLEDGTTVLIESEDVSGVVRAAKTNDGNIRTPSKINFKQAFANVRSSIKDVLAEFDDLHIEEAEIRFGLKSIGEAGLFAIGKVGAEMNYEVTLKWKKPEEKSQK